MSKRLLALVAACVVAGYAFYSRRQSNPPAALPETEVVSTAPEAQATPPNHLPVAASPPAKPATETTPTVPTIASPPYVPPLRPSVPDAIAATLAASNAAIPAVPAEIAPATVLENMRTTVRQYGAMFFGNPVGNNAEITAALNGENPKQVKFINSEFGLRINAQGELIDAWGTPFFFHQLSGTEMEIRSAGPDRQMWTTDDLVTK